MLFLFIKLGLIQSYRDSRFVLLDDIAQHVYGFDGVCSDSLRVRSLHARGLCFGSGVCDR